MQPEELYRLLHQRPFQPFRVFLTDGRILNVHHPDINMVGTTWIRIGIPIPNDPDPIAEYSEKIPLTHIRAVELLPAASTTATT